MYGCPIWGVSKANKWINLENMQTLVTNVAKYSRHFTNGVSETDIRAKMVKGVTRYKQGKSQAAAVHFEG